MNDIADRNANYESSNSSISQTGNANEEFVPFREAVLAKETPLDAVKKVLLNQQRNEHGKHLEGSEFMFKGDFDDSENEAYEYEFETSKEPTEIAKIMRDNSNEEKAPLTAYAKTTKTLIKLERERKQNICK
jgi:hypothetical protein